MKGFLLGISWALLAVWGTANPAAAQRLRRITTYFDSTQTHRHEVYTAVVAGDTVPEGSYRRYYRNGRLEQQTSFRGGKRDSAYVEFQPDGRRRLETTYRDGLRQGPFTTFYADGKPAQSGTFVDDEPTGELLYYYPDGHVKLRTTLVKGQPEGTIREVYASGSPKAEITYAAGQPNGPVHFYFPNGKLQSEGTLRQGLLAGPYKTYYETGQLESEIAADPATGRGGYKSFYPSGKLQTQGTYAPAPLAQRNVKNPLSDDLTKRVAPRTGSASLDGPATSYFESGQIRKKTVYRNGTPTGKEQEFTETGALLAETTYSNNGRDRKIVRSGADGQPAANQFYKNNLSTGTWQYFFAAKDGGKLQAEETYLAGKLSGERRTYFADGQTVASRTPYVGGFISGARQEYYPSGKLKTETAFAHNLANGPHRQLREDGTLEISGLNRNGKASGPRLYYGADGVSISKRENYRNGVLAEAAATSKPASKPRPHLKRR